MVCKKAHLNSKEDCETILNILETECETVRATSDRSDAMWGGSDDATAATATAAEDDSLEREEPPLCDGFSNINHDRSCGAPCTHPSMLWLLMGKEKTKKHFCKPSDALRFVIKYYVHQGVKVNEGRKRQKASVEKDDGC
jgi:hypothetical protein